MEYVRNYQDVLFRLSTLFPVLVLTGARQSGKTTLLRSTFPGHRYVSLDLPSVAEQAEENPGEFLATYPPPVLIDEVQYAPSLFRYLKILVDKERDSYGRFILTGSQSFPLMKGVADSLAGRCVWKELENLSLDEIFRTSGLGTSPAGWSALVTRGLFPELWKRPELPTREFMSSYVATYLERDVRQILNVGSLRDFERFLRLLAVRSGNLLNKSDLARDTGISVKAAGDWISVLEASGQLILLEPWFENLGKRAVKTPKVLIRDPGLLVFLLGLDEVSLGGSPLQGAVWETFALAEIRKLNSCAGKPGKLWFYRDQGGREVDLLLERGGVLDLIEVKWTENPDDDDTASLDAVGRALSVHSPTTRLGRTWLVCRVPAPYTRADGTRVITPLQATEMFRD
jgi:uncharacterized protein